MSIDLEYWLASNRLSRSDRARLENEMAQMQAEGTTPAVPAFKSRLLFNQEMKQVWLRGHIMRC